MLEWDKISFVQEGAYITISVKKNNKKFEKFIPEEVCFYLKKQQNNNSKYVFPTARKHKHKIPVGDMPLTRSGIYQHLRDISPKVFGRHINPYVLRHSIATILYNRDDLKDSDVAQQLSHSESMKETYSHLSTDKIRERMKKIWIVPEDLPPEKKLELKQEIERMKKEIYNLKHIMQNPELERLIAESKKQWKKQDNLKK